MSQVADVPIGRVHRVRRDPWELTEEEAVTQQLRSGAALDAAGSVAGAKLV